MARRGWESRHVKAQHAAAMELYAVLYAIGYEDPRVEKCWDTGGVDIDLEGRFRNAWCSIKQGL